MTGWVATVKVPNDSLKGSEEGEISAANIKSNTNKSRHTAVSQIWFGQSLRSSNGRERNVIEDVIECERWCSLT